MEGHAREDFCEAANGERASSPLCKQIFARAKIESSKKRVYRSEANVCPFGRGANRGRPRLFVSASFNRRWRPKVAAEAPEE